ncbi:MAG: hypothetical protein Q7J05_06320, partial [Paludibacter sp.]|nr:hypothetical protein [Paludibacter sp.]
MNLTDFVHIYNRHPQINALMDWANSNEKNAKISGLNGSALSLIIASLFNNIKTGGHPILMIMEDADEAAYTYHDIKNILNEQDVFFFPSSYKKAIKLSQLDASNEILRTEV